MQTRYPEWQERGDSASAPVGTHMQIPTDAVEERNGRYRLPNGNYVEKTAYFYVIVLMDGEGKGIDIVVSHVQTRYPEWQERGDSASAPVGTHMQIPTDAVEERNGRYRLPNGNYVEKTAYFYVIVLMDGESRPAVITMRSSNLSPARELNNLITNLRVSDDKGTFQPAAYSALFNLKTVGKTAGSKSWHVYKPSKVRMLDVSNKSDADLYIAAQELQKTVAKGSAKPKYDSNSSGS